MTENDWQEARKSEPVESAVRAQSGEVWVVLAPLVMLFGGSVFFLFGLVLFLFAQDGVFTLRWDASYAAFYLIASSLLLYFGWQSLGSVDQTGA